MGKVTNWELCKKLKFDHTNKWYMHNPEFVLENETHKILWDFEIKMDHLISARRTDLVTVNKKKKEPIDFAVPANYGIKLKESEKRTESDGDTNYKWSTRYSHHKNDKGIGGLANKRKNREHSNDRISKISQNTKESPGDLLSIRLQWKAIS